VSIQTRALYTIESPDGRRLFYEAENVDAIILAADYIREDFPGEEWIVKKGGEYDGGLTALAQEGWV